MTRSTTSQHPATRSFPFLLTQRRRTQGYREWLTPAKQAKGKEGDSLTMLWMPPGRFLMGSPADEPERRDGEGPQHEVRLQGFFMAQTPVTQAQWQAVARWRPSPGQGSWSEQLDPDLARRQDRPLRCLGAALCAAEAPAESDLLRLDHPADTPRRGGQIQRAELCGLPAVEGRDREDVAGTEVGEELDLQPDPV